MLFFSHRISGKTPIEEIVATMKEYVEYVSHHNHETNQHAQLRQSQNI